MTFRADRLITSIENQQAIPKEGILEGNVQIHLFSLDQDQSIDRFVPNETEMSITTSRIEYLQEFNKITVPQQVKISTPSFNAQGNYFTIKYDGNKKVIEHFEFRSIDYFKISNNTSSAINNFSIPTSVVGISKIQVRLNQTEKVIENCNGAWSESSGTGVTVSAETEDRREGSASNKFVSKQHCTAAWTLSMRR